MLEQKKIHLYQSIKAPSRLRDRVLSLSGTDDEVSKFTKHPVYYRTGLIVACLVIAFVIIIQQIGQNNSINVFMDGVEISKKTVQLASSESEITLARKIEPLCVALCLSLKEKTEVSVSNGTIHQVNDTDNDFSFSESDSFASGEYDIQWIIFPILKEQNYTMQLKNPHQTFTLSLHYDKDAQNWTIRGN